MVYFYIKEGKFEMISFQKLHNLNILGISIKKDLEINDLDRNMVCDRTTLFDVIT